MSLITLNLILQRHFILIVFSLFSYSCFLLALNFFKRYKRGWGRGWSTTLKPIDWGGDGHPTPLAYYKGDQTIMGVAATNPNHFFFLLFLISHLMVNL
jgi:hypothetical protein